MTAAPEFRNAIRNDGPRCFEIETSAYEGDEAATLEKIEKRIAQYPQGFLILEVEGKIVGFINSGCAFEVVMSVVVDPAEKGKGYSRLLMQEFVRRMTASGKKTIHLMCKDRHVPIYERMGYRYVRPSPSEHGGMSWHEMMMDL